MRHTHVAAGPLQSHARLSVGAAVPCLCSPLGREVLVPGTTQAQAWHGTRPAQGSGCEVSGGRGGLAAAAQGRAGKVFVLAANVSRALPCPAPCCCPEETGAPESAHKGFTGVSAKDEAISVTRAARSTGEGVAWGAPGAGFPSGLSSDCVGRRARHVRSTVHWGCACRKHAYSRDFAVCGYGNSSP